MIKMTHLSWRLLIIPMFGIMLGMVNTQAIAQWKWINANGVPEYSDMPPPPSIPQDKILKRPQKPSPVKKEGNLSEEDEQKIKEAKEAPDLDKQVKEEEEKKKKEEESKKKEQQEQLEKACANARQNLETYQTGQRIRQMNSKGEWEYLDDQQLGQKRKQVQDFLNENCKN